MLTAAWTKLRYHEQQKALWKTKARFVAADCGRGSGKSLLSQRRVVRFLNVQSNFVNPRYFYLLPTYNQARRVAWKNLKSLIPQHWITTIRESDLEIETIYGSTLYVFGMDKPSRFEGLQYDGGIMDECCDHRPGCFTRSVLPALGERHGWCWRIGVPKRFGPSAREFHECCDDWTAKGDEFARFTWPSSDIMTPAEIEIAKSMTSEKDFNEQYNASWESDAGRVYYSYSAESMKSWAYNPQEPIIVGSDFNVSPMAWVLMQMKDGILYVFDELWINNTNTEKTLDELYRRYGKHDAGWYFIGDPEARARNTRSDTTNYLLIKNDLRFKGSQVIYEKSHCPIHDRVGAVNWALRAANGKRSLYIDKKCLHLIKDLSYLAYREGTREIDTRDPEAGHITDALGYVIHKLKPMRSEGPLSIPRVMVA